MSSAIEVAMVFASASAQSCKRYVPDCESRELIEGTRGDPKCSPGGSRRQIPMVSFGSRTGQLK
jgi:hypothetical protein